MKDISIIDQLKSIQGKAGHPTAKDKKLQRLLMNVTSEVKSYAENQIDHLKKLSSIGVALSAEKDINKLLEMIVEVACDLCNADAATLYLYDTEDQSLRFEIMINKSLEIPISNHSDNHFKLPNVPLYIHDEPNYSNVSSYAAHTGRKINLADVSKIPQFPFHGIKLYDETTGYKTQSMLVIPMKDHESSLVGVLQVINALDLVTGEVVAFDQEYEDVIASLASQATVALSNVQLIQNLKNLFYSFIESIALAIDEKSPYTGQHIKRVVDLSMLIAESINQVSSGPLKDVWFDVEELEELRIATWMHDVGKIINPEHIIDKQKKLEVIMDRTELIEARFNIFEKELENEFLKKKLSLLESNDKDLDEIKKLEEAFNKERMTLLDDLDFIKSCNNSEEYMQDDKLSKLARVGKKVMEINQLKQPYLSDNEIERLSVRKGNLTQNERQIIESHASATFKITNRLPFPKYLVKVPEYASSHHEKIDGSGYPLGLKGSEIPLQSRIMAIADIFEALTARDRPYKKPMKLSQALKTLEKMKDENLIDASLHAIFIEKKLYVEYAKKELTAKQIDIEL
ncbi:MAG: GAF domain-containing protein [Deltaproteobacteria bacterium]|nr:GAF domain-containing protein [Deltaproteobacteria bacterium]